MFYGDGGSEKVMVSDQSLDLADSGMQFKHEYAKKGKYKVMFTLSNLVTSLTLKAEATLMNRIQGLDVSVKVKGRGAVENGYGPGHDRYPVNKMIQFNMSVADGDVEKYVIELNGQPLKSTTNPILKYSTAEVNEFCKFGKEEFSS